MLEQATPSPGRAISDPSPARAPSAQLPHLPGGAATISGSFIDALNIASSSVTSLHPMITRFKTGTLKPNVTYRQLAETIHVEPKSVKTKTLHHPGWLLAIRIVLTIATVHNW